MPVENLATAEAVRKPEYTHKSFELVFARFCDKYADRLQKLSHDHGFFDPAAPHSLKQMGRRLNEVSRAIGPPPPSGEDLAPEVDLEEAILLSARYLAWNTVIGSITQQFTDRLKNQIDYQKRRNGGHYRYNGWLAHERDAAVSVLLAQNHALRDFFDSELAHTLGSDSPNNMERLLAEAPYMSEEQRKSLVKGLSLEIASKRAAQAVARRQNRPDVAVAYGSDNEDARGGDLVLVAGEDILFVDVKSYMPDKFPDGSLSTPEDYERGYKWLASEGAERKVLVWAYLDSPVDRESFRLVDRRLASNLELVTGTVYS